MKFSKLFITSALLIIIGYGAGCKKKKKDEVKNADFDRASMLTNIGNNIIVPSYQTFLVEVNKMDSAVTAFNASPDATKLTALQGIFKDTYTSWQLCTAFGFGPADQNSLTVNFNTYPTDSSQINSNISSGSYNLATISNLRAKGFPGLDFLLFGSAANNSSILAKYTTDGNAANRKQYLAALSADIKTSTTTVTNSWLSSNGNYINTFIGSTGTDAGSSSSQLVNAVAFAVDNMKTYEVGVPVGNQTNGAALPGKVEAYYSGISLQLLLTELTAIENVYLGKNAQGVDGIGLDDYLVQINAQYNGGSLNDAIKNQFELAKAKVQLIPGPLSSTVTNNPAAVSAAYTELQKLLVLLKTDMASNMGILITYGDTDGD